MGGLGLQKKRVSRRDQKKGRTTEISNTPTTAPLLKSKNLGVTGAEKKKLWARPGEAILTLMNVVVDQDRPNYVQRLGGKGAPRVHQRKGPSGRDMGENPKRYRYRRSKEKARGPRKGGWFKTIA